MIVKEINGSILNCKSEDTEYILHQCNCFHTMGAGLAKAIAIKYPCAVITDKRTIRGDINKLGTYSIAKDLISGINIVNVYSQFRYGTDKRYTDYDALQKALTLLKQSELLTSTTSIAIPYNFGCGLAGGCWIIVYDIFIKVFKETPIELKIYNNQNI